jgi:hypothetical protein
MASQLRMCHTAAMLCRGRVDGGPVSLEPYEAGWASEALAFVHVHRIEGEGARLSVSLETSSDGLRWAPYSAPVEIAAPGNYRFELQHFGNWLRATLRSTGEAVADFYWVLR